MAWYLKAYCTKKEDYRIFKLTRIIDMAVLADGFRKNSFPESDEAPTQASDTVVLCFPEHMAYRVYDEFDKTMVTRKENGDFIVSAQMPADEWLTGYLLSFGTQVNILKPACLRETVAKQAKKIYEKYCQ